MTRINLDGTIDLTHKVSSQELGDTASGGHHLVSTFNKLVAAFGPPDRSESADGKTTVEWWIATPRGAFTIYDWKEYDAPPREHPDDEYHFHIGEQIAGLGLTAIGIAAATALDMQQMKEMNR